MKPSVLTYLNSLCLGKGYRLASFTRLFLVKPFRYFSNLCLTDLSSLEELEVDVLEWPDMSTDVVVEKPKPDT